IVGARLALGARLTLATLGTLGALTARWSLGRLVADGRQRDLALRIDVLDDHLDVLAELEHVLDAVDTLALTQLRDVEQAVTPRKDVHERTELGDVHDLALVGLADLGGGRVEDQLDAATGLADGLTVLRSDGHRAHDTVVVDVDVGTGLLLQGVDDLALRADDLADLVHRDLEADDLWCGAAHLGPRLGDG